MNKDTQIGGEAKAVMQDFREAIFDPAARVFAMPAPEPESQPGQERPELSTADQVWLDDCFTYHAPTSDQRDRLFEVNGAAREFAQTILANAPPSADRSHALRLVRDARMWANSAVVLEGRR